MTRIAVLASCLVWVTACKPPVVFEGPLFLGTSPVGALVIIDDGEVRRIEFVNDDDRATLNLTLDVAGTVKRADYQRTRSGEVVRHVQLVVDEYITFTANGRTQSVPRAGPVVALDALDRVRIAGPVVLVDLASATTHAARIDRAADQVSVLDDHGPIAHARRGSRSGPGELRFGALPAMKPRVIPALASACDGDYTHLFVESDDTAVLAFAGIRRPALAAAVELAGRVHKMRITRGHPPSASRTVRALDGDCDDFAALLAAALLAQGHRARPVVGLLDGVPHSWVEICVDGEVIEVDPTRPAVGPSDKRVKLGDGTGSPFDIGRALGGWR